MLKTATEHQLELGERIRVRRLGLALSQQEAAVRAGVTYRTWRRLEAEGRASINDLIKAALALRCEEALEMLFPAPAASSLDELLKHQASPKPSRLRAPSRGRRS